MEYLERFGLERDPFRNEPQSEFWFESRTTREARARLLRCLRQGKELSVLCGEVGSGTSTLAGLVLDELAPDQFEVGVVVVGRGVEPAWLRRAVATQLGIESPAPERTDAMRQLYERLVELRQQGCRAVIAIDEAQTLAGSAALGELLAMLNFEADDSLLLSVLLVGSPELDRMLSSEPVLMGRCDLRVRLGALGGDEARAYLAHRIRIAGGDPGLIAPAVADVLADRASGLPRRMNALADNMLFEAHLAGRERPELADVERAARDLPWAQTPADTRSDLSSVPSGGDAEREPKPDVSPAFHSAAVPLDRHARAAASAALAAIEAPDLEMDLGEPLEEELEGTLEASQPPASRAPAPERASADPQASGTWSRQRLVSLDDEILGSAAPVPDESEIDGLFVDLVDAETDLPPRRR
ncbi:AAA family ATPase [Myxococcota bacterium]|nr:AAA family ATPase [Myxococcota bacterium]